MTFVSRWGTVIENVTEVTIAARTDQFRSIHENAAIAFCLNILFGNRLGEAGPAGSGIKFVIGQIEIETAAGTLVNSFFRVLVIFSGEGPLGPLFSEYVELLLGEDSAPFIYTFNHFLGHDVFPF